MPISMLEALAYGLPVVATRVGAVPEVIEDRKCGLLVSPHEPAELSRAMGAIATDRKLLKALSREALALSAKRFSPHRFRDDLLSLYDGIQW
jgi:glycosyltransferase involved in cell wall biosynthesis